MQMLDLIKPIDDMTDEELKEQLVALRHRRSVVRPAAAKKVKKAADKGKTSRINKLAGLFDNLSDSDKQAMLKALGE